MWRGVIVEQPGQSPDRPMHLVAFDTDDGAVVAVIPLAPGPATYPVSYLPLPDGRFAVTYETGVLEVIAAEEIVVHDVGLEQPLVRLTGLPSGASRISSLADDMLLTRHFDGSTLLWDLDEAALVGRPLTQDELDAVASGRTLLDPCELGAHATNDGTTRHE